MAKILNVTCGTHRHPQPVRVTHIRSIEDDLRPDSIDHVAPESVVLTLKPKFWVRDDWGDGQWHGVVCADRADVAKLLSFCKVGRS